MATCVLLLSPKERRGFGASEQQAQKRARARGAEPERTGEQKGRWVCGMHCAPHAAVGSVWRLPAAASQQSVPAAGRRANQQSRAERAGHRHGDDKAHATHRDAMASSASSPLFSRECRACWSVRLLPWPPRRAAAAAACWCARHRWPRWPARRLLPLCLRLLPLVACCMCLRFVASSCAKAS